MTSVQNPKRLKILIRVFSLTTAAICVAALMNSFAEAQSADHSDNVDVATLHCPAQLDTAPCDDPDMTREAASGQKFEPNSIETPWRPVRWYRLSD